MTINGPNGQADDGGLLAEQAHRLARENIARLIAFKANPPPAPPQEDYKVKPLAVRLPGVLSNRERKRLAHAAKYEALYGRRAAEHQQKCEPVRMTAIAPYPNSTSILDGVK